MHSASMLPILHHRVHEAPVDVLGGELVENILRELLAGIRNTNQRHPFPMKQLHKKL